MIPVVFKLTWQTRTANLEGELRGSVLNDHHKQLLLTDLSVRGFRAEDVSGEKAEDDRVSADSELTAQLVRIVDEDVR